jgi:hypothetical protein
MTCHRSSDLKAESNSYLHIPATFAISRHPEKSFQNPVTGKRLEVFTVVKTWIVVFWVVTPCSVVDGYQCFGETTFMKGPHNDHTVQTWDTNIRAKKSKHMAWIIQEVMQNKFHPNDMNREDGFSLSRSWKPLICILKA